MADFAAEHAVVLPLVLVDLLLDFGSGHSRLRAANNSWPNGTGFLVAIEDFADTAVTDPELSGDDARPHAGRRHLNYLEADVIWQRSAIDKNAA